MEGLQVYSASEKLLVDVDSRLSRMITQFVKTAPTNTATFSVSNNAFAGMDIYVFCPTVNHMVKGNTFPSFAYFTWTRVSDTEISITYGYKGGWGNTSAPNLPFYFTVGVY